MIVKFMRKSRGSSGAVEYLLNERVGEGTAKVLQGNSEITRQLIRQIDRKQKYISGGLFFEKGELVSNELKKRLIEDFEKMFFVGVPEDRYNILWIEHTDKDRLELNFLIPDIDLETGYGLNIWSFKRDLAVVDMWKDIQNIKYGLSDPNDPRRQRTQSERTNDARARATSKTIVANRKEIDKQLHRLVSEGAIQSREQMIKLLQDNGFEIARKGKEYISIKHQDLGKKALRLKGGIYSEHFRELESIGEIGKETKRKAREYYQRDRNAELRELEKRYRKYLQDRNIRSMEIYKKRDRRANQQEIIEAVDISLDSTIDRFDVREHRDVVFNEQVYTQQEHRIRQKNLELRNTGQQIRNVVQEDRGVEYDGTGADAFKRIRTSREKRRKAIQAIQARIEADRRKLRERIEADQQRVRERVASIAKHQYSIVTEHKKIVSKIGRIIAKIKRIREKVKSFFVKQRRHRHRSI